MWWSILAVGAVMKSAQRDWRKIPRKLLITAWTVATDGQCGLCLKSVISLNIALFRDQWSFRPVLEMHTSQLISCC